MNVKQGCSKSYVCQRYYFVWNVFSNSIKNIILYVICIRKMLFFCLGLFNG